MRKENSILQFDHHKIVFCSKKDIMFSKRINPQSDHNTQYVVSMFHFDCLMPWPQYFCESNSFYQHFMIHS